jgi:hypothetical protein
LADGEGCNSRTRRGNGESDARGRWSSITSNLSGEVTELEGGGRKIP